ncbi:hypothetical protein MPTK1_7g00570 [Marchantia polymorpha subsp. ruderalis]|uniref:RING-type domain-containing protein n=2 Tax=Marchantia polymorpha TaxID=3197 RepID=A0AAF6BUS7_MARPO|nr:hypothetical protein MARPO_0046s0068 [Marchantia polymorpha]BBN15761.1 hypothetical protein Mp_7g00570 [Marchantia polymorpha subsp. ruderalis]|eukprot:PTQ39247.1 hypothetical protein MARPO_0046s0068 [Marchantia polymorpha]
MLMMMWSASSIRFSVKQIVAQTLVNDRAQFDRPGSYRHSRPHNAEHRTAEHAPRINRHEVYALFSKPYPPTCIAAMTSLCTSIASFCSYTAVQSVVSRSAPRGFSEDGLVLFNCQRSDLAAEIESNTCPICFELMKSPDYPPIVLSPCGHSFCAKCLSVHVGSQRKKLCPYCRQKIASTAVNLSLQRLIDSFVNLQDRRHHIAQADHDKELFLDRLSAAETRSCILRNELAEALERRKKLESDKTHINILHGQLQHKQAEAREILRRVTSENEAIDREIQLIECQREDVQKLVDEENAKTALVESSLRELITECEKYRLFLLNQRL